MVKTLAFYNYWDLRAFILSFEMAFVFCFFIGIFWNPPVRMEVFNERSWYYINRGYPISWAGVSKPNRTVNFPIIRAPFLTNEISQDKYDKIIDLRVFIPLFIAILLGSYVIAFIFSYFAKKNKFINLILVSNIVILIFISIYSYFFWFPRI
jgi:hypothetical protein